MNHTWRPLLKLQFLSSQKAYERNLSGSSGQPSVYAIMALLAAYCHNVAQTYV